MKGASIRTGKRISRWLLVPAILVLVIGQFPVFAAEDERTIVRRSTLIVGDIDESIEFYRDVLGYTRWYYNEGKVSEGSIPADAELGDPSIFAIMKGRDPWIGMVGLLQKGTARSRTVDPSTYSVSPGDVILMMETDDLDGIYERMRATNTPIWKHPETTTVTGAGGKQWDATFLFAFDPDGHLLEINQPHREAETFAGTRRAFSDTRTGQLHYRYTAPRKGTPLVLLHQSPLSGRMYRHLIPELADRRQVLAPDTPGFGESAPPNAPPELGDYSDALIDWLDELGLQQVDLFGYHTGSAIAADLAARYPARVRAIILMSVPLFDEDRRRGWNPGPMELEADGSHVLDMWNSTYTHRAPGQTLEMVGVTVAEKQRAGSKEWWGIRALSQYPLEQTLAHITRPVSLIIPGDSLQKQSAAAAALLQDASVIERPQWGYGIFDTQATAIAALIETMLDENNTTSEGE